MCMCFIFNLTIYENWFGYKAEDQRAPRDKGSGPSGWRPRGEST